MKNLLILSSLALFFLFSSFNAQGLKLEKNKEGKYRLASQGWEDTGIMVEEAAQEYIDIFPVALAAPGTGIVVEQTKTTTKFVLLFEKIVLIQDRGIIYDDSQKLIKLLDVKTEKVVSNYVTVLAGLLSLFFTGLAGILRKTKMSNFDFYFAFLATGAYLVFMATTVAPEFNPPYLAPPYLIFFMMIAFASSLISFLSLATRRHYIVFNTMYYIVFNTMYYISAIISFALLYI